MERKESGVYDVANWKPFAHQALAEKLGSCFLTVDEPETVTVKCETLSGMEFLRDDGRLRLVVMAECKTEPDKSEVAPYLMILYSPETGKVVCFERTDVGLAHP